MIVLECSSVLLISSAGNLLNLVSAPLLTGTAWLDEGNKLSDIGSTLPSKSSHRETPFQALILIGLSKFFGPLA